MNPFKNLINVLREKELLDYIFYRASKVSVEGLHKLDTIRKARKKELFRIRTIETELTKKLNQYIKSYPNFDSLHPFYYELTNILIDGGVDKIRKILASFQGGINVINKITRETAYKIKKSEDTSEMARLRVAYYGRISSVVKKFSKRFQELIEIREILRKLPDIDTSIPTIVVAGYPNVGKSSLVKAISTAKPEIAYYPFTTRKIIVGIFKQDDFKVQIIDSPGLLDRPLSKRNKIELQSILALKYLAKLIIYMIDPSETCGYPINEQISLFDDLIRNFSEIPFIIVQNKIDLYPNKYEKLNKYNNQFEIYYTDLLNLEGVDEIKRYRIEFFKNST